MFIILQFIFHALNQPTVARWVPARQKSKSVRKPLSAQPISIIFVVWMENRTMVMTSLLLLSPLQGISQDEEVLLGDWLHAALGWCWWDCFEQNHQGQEPDETLQERISRLASGVALIRWVYYFKASRPWIILWQHC